jgi:hypothetical protein
MTSGPLVPVSIKKVLSAFAGADAKKIMCLKMRGALKSKLHVLI